MGRCHVYCKNVPRSSILDCRDTNNTVHQNQKECKSTCLFFSIIYIVTEWSTSCPPNVISNIVASKILTNLIENNHLLSNTFLLSTLIYYIVRILILSYSEYCIHLVTNKLRFTSVQEQLALP